MNNTITFNKSGYDPFIDFLKGFSILSVVLTHNLPMAVKDWTLFYAWGIQAVPIFLIIQVFHSYKKGLSAKPHYDFRKLLKRIIMPFLMVQAIFIILLYSMGDLDKGKIMTFIKLGGYGAGSYYVWVYIQFYLILPLFSLIISRLAKSKMGGVKIAVLFIVISWGCEIVCSLVGLPHLIYRLSCIRYLFLIYLGWQWAENGVQCSKVTSMCSAISLASILAFHYFTPNLEPFFFNAWEVCHWICYFFTATTLIAALKSVYDKLPCWLATIFRQMGRWSYEIFLLQMLVFGFYPRLHSLYKDFMPSCVEMVAFVAATTALSIAPVLIYKRIRHGKDLSIIK